MTRGSCAANRVVKLLLDLSTAEAQFSCERRGRPWPIGEKCDQVFSDCHVSSDKTCRQLRGAICVTGNPDKTALY